MPLYSYRCKACSHEFETLVRSSDVPVCLSCGSPELEKLVSLPASEGKSKKLIGSARAQAAREGHFSHYSPSERPRR